MKYLLRACAACFVVCIIAACNRSGNEIPRSENDQVAKIAVTDTTGVSTETQIKLPERRFLRTASLKTKVPSVSEAVTAIENKTRALGGFVSFSQFVNQVSDSAVLSVSRDSSMQVMHYRVSGFLTLRVPDTLLDSLLAALSPMSSVILNREVRAEDVSVQMLSHQLTVRRAGKIRERLGGDIRQSGKKLADIEHAEMTLDEKQALADEAKIDALHLEDAVRFSTVTLEIYQDPGIRYTTIAKEKDITAYQAPFISRLGASLSEGWQGFGDFLIFLFRYWIILIMAAIGYGVYVKQFTRAKKVA